MYAAYHRPVHIYSAAVSTQPHSGYAVCTTNIGSEFKVSTTQLISTMAVYSIALVVCVMSTLAAAQRPFYAGTGAIGYPQLQNEAFQISNRFGEDDPVPIQVLNDRRFAAAVERLPIDNRPFWYTNWQAYDNLRRQPQTWPQKPNNFIDK